MAIYIIYGHIWKIIRIQTFPYLFCFVMAQKKRLEEHSQKIIALFCHLSYMAIYGHIYHIWPYIAIILCSHMFSDRFCFMMAQKKRLEECFQKIIALFCHLSYMAIYIIYGHIWLLYYVLRCSATDFAL